MHHLFVTEGLVLGKRAVGEAHTLVSILTRELGLLRAHATSTRVENSKLRYGLEPLTLGRFTFVAGKYEWKLTGVERASRALVSPAAAQRAAAGRITKLILRLVHGAQEESSALFSTAQEGLTLLARATPQEAQSVECILVLRLLSHLGYLPHTAALAPFIEGDFASVELNMNAQASRAFLIRTINESLQASGL